MAVICGRASLSSMLGRRALPSTRSSSCCAASCVQGYKAMALMNMLSVAAVCHISDWCLKRKVVENTESVPPMQFQQLSTRRTQARGLHTCVGYCCQRFQDFNSFLTTVSDICGRNQGLQKARPRVVGGLDIVSQFSIVTLDTKYVPSIAPSHDKARQRNRPLWPVSSGPCA